MAELHPIVLHFHIALLAFSFLTTLLAILIALFDKTDFFNRDKVKRVFRGRVLLDAKTCKKYSHKFEFVAFVVLIYGLFSLLIAAIAGFLDASGNFGINNISIDNFLLGISSAAKSETISFKVIWSIIGTSFFLYAAVIRFYFVTYRKVRFYDQHPLYWVIYVLSQGFGYIILTLVAGAGALIVYGGTLITDIPILGNFLPGGTGDLLPLVLIISLVLVFITVFAGFSQKPEQITPKEGEHSEHEVTLWPAALAFGTIFVAFAILLFTQGKVVSALGFFWIFFIVLLGFIYNEAYTQKLFNKPKEGWIWLFLGSEVILFSMIIGTSFGLRIASGTSWPNPSEILNVPLTAINTFILIISSFTMVKSVDAIQQGKQKQLRNYLIATVGLGVLFLSIQMYE
ncbi:MAG: cytochrome c oxidase subunit 3, partial [Candidatus Kariarchaeaceae archaeon]